MIDPFIPGFPGIALFQVRLRDPAPDDASRLFQWRNEESVRAHQPLVQIGIEQIRHDLEKNRSNELPDYSRDRFQWIIERIEDHEALGWITLTIRSWEHEIAEVGYSLSRDHQGKGYGTEAIKILLRKLFYEARLYRVEAKCSIENAASARLLEKSGFRKEGILRDYFNIRGQRVDHYLYSIIRPDYFANN